MAIVESASRPIIAAVLVACLTAAIIKRMLLRNKVAKFPGPWLTSFSHMPHSKAMLSGDVHNWYAKISQDYGPVARIAPGLLITSSPEVWAHVNNYAGYKRSDWYYHACRVEYRRDNVFTQTNNEKHARRRKEMAPGVC